MRLLLVEDDEILGDGLVAGLKMEGYAVDWLTNGKLANEALEIANRCEYRLKQAEIHNFLVEFYLETNELSKANDHVKIAKERAECGYVPAMKKAEELERRIGSTD